jgi:hypothetical protein
MKTILADISAFSLFTYYDLGPSEVHAQSLDVAGRRK